MDEIGHGNFNTLSGFSEALLLPSLPLITSELAVEKTQMTCKREGSGRNMSMMIITAEKGEMHV